MGPANGSSNLANPDLIEYSPISQLSGKKYTPVGIYPSREDSVNVSLFANGGSANVKTLRAWKMMPSSPY